MANPYPGGGVNDVQRQTINLAVLHHTVTPENYTWKQLSDIGKTRTYAGYDHSYHYDPETGEETFIAYHFIVYKDGTYRRCLNDAAVGWHCGNWEKNCRSIAVSSVGDFSSQDPTEAQLQTIANIIRPYDRAVNGALSILGHKDISSTACPGRIQNFRDRIVELVNSEPTPPPVTPPSDDPCAAITQQFHETNDLLVKTQAQVEELQAQLAAEQQTSLRLTGENVTLVNKMNTAFAELETTKTQFDNFVRDSRVEHEALRDHARTLEGEITSLQKQIEDDKAHAAAQMAVAEGQITKKDKHIQEIETLLNDANLKLKSQSDLIARLQTETLQAVDNKALFSEFMRRIWKIRRG